MVMERTKARKRNGINGTRIWMRLTALVICLVMLTGGAGAENLFDEQPASEESIRDVTEYTLYDTLNDGTNQVVNADPAVPENAELTEYSYTPLDVTLVLDVSGSMDATTRGGQQVLTLAQEAAKIFVTTLFSLSAPSRIGLIAFDSGVYRLTQGSLGLSEENELIRKIRSTVPGSATNTGGALEEAERLLSDMQRPDTRQVVILLTDGIPVGDGDPDQYAISAGNALKRDNRLIYTIGLVGALGNGEKKTARKVLNAGYETRYFEVDNQNGGANVQRNMGSYNAYSGADYASMMAGIFQAIVMSATDQTGMSRSYSGWIDGNMEIRVTDSSGKGYLSSSPLDYNDTAPFGSLSVVGEDKNQKILTLKDGHYVIMMRGTRTGKSNYSLSMVNGYSMIPETLDEAKDVITHPAHVLKYEIDEDRITKTDLSWEPLDHTATDPFTGEATRGSEIAAAGRVASKGSLYSWMSKNAASVMNVNTGLYVQALAVSEDGEWVLAATSDKEGRTVRGWLPAATVQTEGYVPVLITDEAKTYAVNQTVAGRAAPMNTAAEVRELKAGETVTGIHAERDVYGREWAYVLTESKKAQAVYVPADTLEGWTILCPEGFRIGYASPVPVWEKSFGGNGYTEFMWVASELNGKGVAVSGRTSSSAAPLKAKYGNRDALAMILTPEGEIDRSNVLGGSGDMDSFHCIVPAEDGYYVSGVTRSNNKDFEGIWDESTFTGNRAATHKRTNALIGKLNQDLSIAWMKSFGVGSVSFGFDMAVETADGKIAGCGWLTKNTGFADSGRGGQDFLVMKLTKDGQLSDWTVLGSSAEDVPDSAAPTDDGGLMLAGLSGNDARIFVLGPGLEETGGMTYGGSGNDLFDNVRNLGDGSYLVTGMTEMNGSSDFWAMQVDEGGRMIWQKTYGGSGKEEVCGTAVLPDGTLLIVGYTESTDGTVQGSTGKGKDAWAVCIDRMGRLLWQYTAYLAGNDWFNAAAVDPADGGIVLVGTRECKNDKSAKGYAVKLMPPETMEP